jgi:hypothetical protein
MVTKLKKLSFLEVVVKKVKKTVSSKEMVEYLNLILWPGSLRSGHCHAAKLEPN